MSFGRQNKWGFKPGSEDSQEPSEPQLPKTPGVVGQAVAENAAPAVVESAAPVATKKKKNLKIRFMSSRRMSIVA